MKNKNYKKDFIHYQNSRLINGIREVVFGVEDGMVSTLGSITGIAIGTNSHYTVLLAGFVVIMVESVSMGIGSYLSSKSVKEIESRKIKEERYELKNFPESEKKELADLYVKDGWPKDLARKMAVTAAENPRLILKEMSYRELNIVPKDLRNPFLGGLLMFLSYIIGGIVPILAYLFLPVSSAINISIFITMIGLFVIGALTTRLTELIWWKIGLRMLFLGGIATLIGYLVGRLSLIWI